MYIQVTNVIDKIYRDKDGEEARTIANLATNNILRRIKTLLEKLRECACNGGWRMDKTHGRQHFEKYLPEKAECLAFRFAAPYISINASLARTLASVNRADLLQISAIVTTNVNVGSSSGGTSQSQAVCAMEAAANASTKVINLEAKISTQRTKINEQDAKIAIMSDNLTKVAAFVGKVQEKFKAIGAKEGDTDKALEAAKISIKEDRTRIMAVEKTAQEALTMAKNAQRPAFTAAPAVTSAAAPATSLFAQPLIGNTGAYQGTARVPKVSPRRPSQGTGRKRPIDAAARNAESTDDVAAPKKAKTGNTPTKKGRAAARSAPAPGANDNDSFANMDFSLD